MMLCCISTTQGYPGTGSFIYPGAMNLHAVPTDSILNLLSVEASPSPTTGTAGKPDPSPPGVLYPSFFAFMRVTLSDVWHGFCSVE